MFTSIAPAKCSSTNVTNAVWVMDYSSSLRAGGAPLAHVDWLFFNTFQKQDFPSFTSIAGSIYASLITLKVPDIENVPLGLGAFGTHDDLSDGARADFLNFAAKDLNDASFPRIRAAIYFVSLRSAVNGTKMLAEYKTYINTKFFTGNDA